MQPEYLYKARITKIVDGDTVDATVDLGFRLTAALRLRLVGINTPELNSQLESEKLAAKSAKEYASKLLLLMDVIIRTQKSDAFGRYLATIFIKKADGSWMDFNAHLIEVGLADPFE